MLTKQKKSGFTLVEVLLSTVLLTIMAVFYLSEP
ncbi:MAG: prepilin-type N-terminal cleavage/methylation domain-containing protein [Deltaproteobacteria bacterium]|nr:prepilin-type N-terminal cleavage/methylation domain-containing protein [Deltaproteobacteria bacterium]